MHFAGPEMDDKGNIYATGFIEGPPETGGQPELIFGDTYLYRINKRTGVATRVGNTGRADWMDLAFDSKGRLWATTDNMLYQLDTKTGAAKFITNITGVPQTNIPDMPPEDWPYMEVMTIAFDANDVLWATGIKGFVIYLGNSPVMRIDTKTGKATVVGYTNKGYNHGGDILLFGGQQLYGMLNND
jgi:outer membrane protein assembly factor BamB